MNTPLSPTFHARRILVLQQRQIGDVLLITPALELLRRRFPDAAIHVLTERKCLPMLEHNPHVDHVWVLDKKKLTNLWREVQWYWHAARSGYDLVVNFQPTLPRLRWIVGFSRAKVRLTSSLPWYLRPLYTHIVPPVPGYAAASKVALLSILGITWNNERPRLYLTEDEKANARHMLATLGLGKDDIFITLDPTHRQETRRWPLENYARMMHLMIRQQAAAGHRLRILPLWGPGENNDIRQLIAIMQGLGCANSLLLPDHMLSLRASAACQALACLHVGNCSAPRHIAVAVGTPSCIAMGSTGQEWTCPPLPGKKRDHLGMSAGLPCQPCQRNRCPRIGRGQIPPCLTALTPERMSQSALDMLDPAVHMA